MNPAGLLARFHLLVLERTAPDTFRAAGVLPPWAAEVLPGIGEAEPLRLEGVEPFLEGFLPQAEEFWAEGPHGSDGPDRPEDSLASGIWMAGPHEVPVEATATWHEGQAVLILQGLQAFFPEQERQLQLAREHLLLNERLARETERRQVLVHCVVHDLNSPLSSLKLALDMLPGIEKPEDRDRILELARRQVTKQADLVTDILEAFKAEAAALTEGATEALTPAEVEGCLRDVGAELEPSLLRKSIELIVDAAPEVRAVAAIRGSANRLRRLVFNLADNAARIAPRGSHLWLRIRTGNAGGLRVLVEDEGPGLEPNAEHEIFHKLRQGRGGRGKLGLGLYYCRITARSWGGDVGCENRAEGGARFWIELVPPGAAAPGAGGMGAAVPGADSSPG